MVAIETTGALGDACSKLRGRFCFCILGGGDSRRYRYRRGGEAKGGIHTLMDEISLKTMTVNMAQVNNFSPIFPTNWTVKS
ncbi:hypothetical protein K1719_004124 [Acacia pycnantha]|nr:hypothetical protein K1719_004124 [Acacia pycnantha]